MSDIINSLSLDSRHSIYEEMREVHGRLMDKYNIEASAKVDIQRAKDMTTFLRKFKKASSKLAARAQGDSSIMLSLEEEAMAEIIEEVGASLGIDSYKLFYNRHFWYGKSQGDRSSQALWGTDDVFEAELDRFLNIAYEKATGIMGDAKAVGNLPGNIASNFMTTLNEEGPSLVKKYRVDNDLISTPEFRSNKVDVQSFSGTITATIKPEWEQFIKVFKGARFTVKNYASDNSQEVIHLGQTNIQKSLISTLSELNYNDKQAAHIFYHAIACEASQGQHLFHLRFAYELTGGGLYDKDKNKIDEADFFIYNDPATDNIWVRSTKEMISEALGYQGTIQDPLRSGIVVLKNKFS